MATELAIETSDFDIAICGLNIESSEKLAEYISSLATELCHMPFVTQCNPITTAKVPVIKLVSNERK
jgi:DNA polymerase sigma